MQELSQLQDKHATCPDVFDDVEEEQEREILTWEVTQMDKNYLPLTLKSVSTPHLPPPPPPPPPPALHSHHAYFHSEVHVYTEQFMCI